MRAAVLVLGLFAASCGEEETGSKVFVTYQGGAVVDAPGIQDAHTDVDVIDAGNGEAAAPCGGSPVCGGPK